MEKKPQQEKSPKNTEKSGQHTDKMSRKDIEEMMGMNRDIYTRRNGAVRRK